MADIKRPLLSMFKPENRFSNFGSALAKIRISGFRGIQNFEITFNHPITALSGTNGSGKSTIAQLVSCGYKKIATDLGTKRYYVKDFINITTLDPTPVDTNSFVEYHYSTSILGREQTVTVKRASSEWSGYKRQPERTVWYVGFTLYIPKVERKDFSVYQAQNLTVGQSRHPNEDVIRWTNKILGNSYSDIDFTTITHESKRTEVGRLTRDGARYSENNMGFGEGRILYLVDLLEKSPSNSLIILEEPETSLHPVAQYNLSQYLLDVVHRKKHQIVLTTHSESILSGLPVESRKFLLRQGSTIHVIDGISSTHAASFLTGNHLPALTIAVEDEFAQQLLVELLRKKNAELLNRVLIKPAGDTKAVAQAVKILNDNNKNAIAIRDGDKGEDHPKRLYKLPGTMAPEKEVIQNDSVKNLLETYYDINVEAFLGEYHDLDHHEYFEKLAAKAHVRINTLETECSRRYVEALESEEIDRIYNLVAGNL